MKCSVNSFSKNSFVYMIFFDFTIRLSILSNAVLGGEIAVSCNLQSALARLNPFSRLSVL